MQFVVAALYHFFDFSQFEEMRMPMLREMKQLEIKGTLLNTPEGINGTVAGSRESIDALLAYLKKEVIKGPFEHKESFCDTQPFPRTKVRLKKETISIGEPTDVYNVGTYVKPQEWNALIEDPDVVIVDARNDYEICLGTFDGARNPNTRNFKQLPAYARKELEAYKKKKIATFCTGGIRCEKFTSWLIGQGFEDVYHLQGGILKYLEEIPQSESKWQGECYVFDGRVAVGHGLAASNTATRCRPCGSTLTPEDRAHPLFVEGVSCGHCQSAKAASHSGSAHSGNLEA